MSSSTAALHRLNVKRYSRSGRFAAFNHERGVGWIVCDLDDELRKMRGVPFLKRLAHERLEPTPYMVEIEIVVGPRSSDEVTVTADLIRTLSSADTDLDRWRAEPDLNVLPVSPHPEFTREERAWPGEQDGTLGEGVFHVVGALVGTFGALVQWEQGRMWYAGGLAILALIFGQVLRDHQWRLPR